MSFSDEILSRKMQILQKERKKSDYRSVLFVAHYQMTVDITKALKGIKVSVIKSEGNNNPNAEDRLFLRLNFCQFHGCLC